jgi:hypothetical protein
MMNETLRCILLGWSIGFVLFALFWCVAAIVSWIGFRVAYLIHRLLGNIGSWVEWIAMDKRP